MQEEVSVKKKERPILFSTEMVQAILAGNKTQTRRAIKPKHFIGEGAHVNNCPHGQVGDRLWVRETWSVSSIYDNQKPCDMDSDYAGIVRYKADGYRSGKLRPSIFMPRWASRITLEITDIRVERLHDISKQDAIAEGIAPVRWTDGSIQYLSYTTKTPTGKRIESLSAKQSYFSLWEKINGRKSLESNPWVWVIEFKCVEVRHD